jgi:hypothetical protein
MNEVEIMHISFMVLFINELESKISIYLARKTIRYNSWVFKDKPIADFVERNWNNKMKILSI